MLFDSAGVAWMSARQRRGRQQMRRWPMFTRSLFGLNWPSLNMSQTVTAPTAPMQAAYHKNGDTRVW